MLLSSLFSGVKLSRNAHPDQYSYSGYDSRAIASLSDGIRYHRNVTIFVVCNSSSAHVRRLDSW